MRPQPREAILKYALDFTAALVLSLGLCASAGAQDTSAGRKIFQSQCSICHSAQSGRNITGPSLFGVVGRHSGTIPDFHYSSANQQSGLSWDVLTLDRYLTAPQIVVPGTLMTFPGLKDGTKRRDLIAYLATLQ